MFPKTIAAIGGFALIGFGIWAMASPAGFFDALARFEPYNAHFLQDIGAFQIGLGAMLLLAAFVTSDALTAALVGGGAGALLHVVSHLVSLDAGGNPGVDVPSLSLLGGLLVWGGVVRWRQVRAGGARRNRAVTQD